MHTKERGRRRFLKGGAVLAGWAMGAVRSARGQTPGSETPETPAKDTRAYGERSRFENAVRAPVTGKPTAAQPFPIFHTPLQDSVGIITPSSLHFTSTHSYPVRDMDPRQHRLLIHGMVDRPLILTVEELKRLPSVSRIHFVECAGNSYLYQDHRVRNAETVQQTHGKTSCSEWTGVLVSLLLREAGVQKGASWLVAESADQGKLTMSIPLEKGMDDVMVAYAQNGEPVRPEQGYPLKFLVPGWEGVRNIKWLRRIKVVDQPYMTKFESTGYPSLRPDGKARWFLFQKGPKSVITFPSGGQRLPGPGFYEITGLAWSGGGAVRRVEVSTDGGRSWKDAQLQEPVLRIAHTRFRFAWTWNGEEAMLQSRCTDELGQVQPTKAEMEKLWGVQPDYWLSTSNGINNFNAVQPWKLDREGRLRNAIWES